MGKLGTGCNGVAKKELLFKMNSILVRSASGAGQGSIDNRIEQAMDLVKSHLMSAVRSEVEELRDKIKSLEDTVQILSNENTVLRGAVTPDVLAQLTGPRTLLTLQGPAVLGSLPAPEPAQLQPPQH